MVICEWLVHLKPRLEIFFDSGDNYEFKPLQNSFNNLRLNLESFMIRITKKLLNSWM